MFDRLQAVSENWLILNLSSLPKLYYSTPGDGGRTRLDRVQDGLQRGPTRRPDDAHADAAQLLLGRHPLLDLQTRKRTLRVSRPGVTEGLSAVQT